MNNELVQVKKNEVYTTSVIIAEQLGVTHKDILRTVEKAVNRQKNNVPASTLKFPQVFIESTFKNKMGRTYPMYLMNEQAFIKLAMQLSGYEKAEVVQDMVIDAFFMMKETISQHQNASWQLKRKDSKDIRLEETDVIKEFVDYATSQGSRSAKMYYMNITKMTNKALELLLSVKDDTPIRDFANIMDLGFIQIVDNRAKQCLSDGMKQGLPYKYIYKQAKEQVNKLVDSLSFKQLS